MRLALALSLALLLAGVATSSTRAASERSKLVQKIDRYITETQTRQTVMGVRTVSTRRHYRHQRHMGRLRRAVRIWGHRAYQTWQQYRHPPHEAGWWCIHRYEGSWTDSGDPFWGGLQMDRSFMSTYAPWLLLRKGYANAWTPLEQMWVAERAHRSGRGYYPWPNTARYCGLL